jgi:hypothetical protein
MFLTSLTKLATKISKGSWTEAGFILRCTMVTYDGEYPSPECLNTKNTNQESNDSPQLIDQRNIKANQDEIDYVFNFFYGT